MTGPGSLKQKKRGGDLSVRGRDLSSAQLQVSEVLIFTKLWDIKNFYDLTGNFISSAAAFPFKI